MLDGSKSSIISIHALLAESDANSQQEKNNGHEFLSTLSLRRATTLIWDVIAEMTISIHALLAESDSQQDKHHPHHGREFLSTLSLRRATGRHRGNDRRPINFYPRSPCGERLVDALKLADLVLFLSTLSLRRATIISQHGEPNSGNFYPRSPCGERHSPIRCCTPRTVISIHALLAESDRLWIMLYSCPGNFYPRSPCGERLLKGALP